MRRINFKIILISAILSLFWIFIGGALGHFVFPSFFYDVEVKIFGEPEIIFNLTELRPVSSINYLEDFNLLFGTSNGTGLLLLTQLKNKDLNEKYGYTPVPIESIKEAIDCENCVEYSFTLKNVGTRKAKNIEIDLSSLFDIKILELEKSENIIIENCGGFADNRFCYLKIEELEEDSDAGFTAYTQEPGIRNIECRINSSDGLCRRSYRHFYVQKVVPGLVFEMNERKIQFPSINKDVDFIQYYYLPEEDRWEEFK